MKQITRSLSLMLTVLILLVLLPVSLLTIKVGAAVLPGEGTSEKPYVISTKAQLNGMRDYKGKYFRLANDIVFSPSDFGPGGDFYNGGAGWLPIGDNLFSFVGHLDGNGKAIRGLEFNFVDTGNQAVGFFGYFEGTIKDLNVFDVNMRISTDRKSNLYGGIIAGIIRESQIQNCTVSGNIDISAPEYMSFGGITGSATNTTISKCSNTSNISLDKSSWSSNNNVGGIVGSCGYGVNINNCANLGDILIAGDLGAQVGGIAGKVSSFEEPSFISDCYNTGSIRVSILEYDGGYPRDIGGIVGDSYGGDITRCYNAGDLTGEGFEKENLGGIAAFILEAQISDCYNIGMLVGYEDKVGAIVSSVADAEVINCYYLNNIDKGIQRGTGETYKKTVSEMQKQSTYTGFLFPAHWVIDDSQGFKYPQLADNPHIRALISKLVLESWSRYHLGEYLENLFTESTSESVKKHFLNSENIVIYDAKDNKVIPESGFVGTGCIVRYMKDNKVEEEIKAVVLGDISGDGRINASDYLLAKRAFLGTTTLTGPQLKAAALSGSDTVKSSDYLMIKRHFLGTYDIFAIPA